jgi:hypothetical protein
MSDEKLIGPITLEAKVYFTNADGDVTGSANVGLGAGRPVTLEALHRAVGQTLAALPDDCRLLSPDAFFNKVLVKEKTGRIGHFATPSSFHYDVDALAQAGRVAYTPEPEPESDDESDDEGFDEDEDDF